MTHKLFTPDEIKSIDKEALKTIDLNDLIDEVGSALGEWFLKNISLSESIFILCGPGNNGNDGRALNKYLNENGYTSKVVDLKNLEEKEVEESVLVDAAFGISLDRELSKGLQNFITLNKNKKIISIDVPSGVNVKSGEVLGSAFKAHTTLTIGALKVGLFLFPGRSFAGEIVCIPVKSLDTYFDECESDFVSLDLNDTTSYPKNSPSDHKYTKGVSAFVMSKAYPGASILAAKASVASGTGYVKVYTPEEHLLNSQLSYPDFVFESYKNENELCSKLLEDEKINSLCLGVGWDLEAEELLPLFRSFKKGLVIDGGAMKPEVLKAVKEKENLVFTPHKGEQDRAFGDQNKASVMEGFYEGFKGVLISKGYDTLIGQRGHKKVLTLTNSPKLSVAGTGDVLAGLVTGLMARGLGAYESALMAQRLQFLGAESSFQRMSSLDLIESIKRLRLYDND